MQGDLQCEYHLANTRISQMGPLPGAITRMRRSPSFSLLDMVVVGHATLCVASRPQLTSKMKSHNMIH